ncbi:hypothetical protein [Fluviicola sp.]|uniref:hypothetical protein n=1 Tax=Fluviicola sp. TaxID=1917219 RepID=UPI0031DEE775
MLFKRTYHFQFPKNKELLIRELKDLSQKDLVQKATFGSDTFYSVEFNWDEFVVSSRAKMFERNSFSADAYIRFQSLPEDLTQINVTIKYSEISWFALIFIQLLFAAGCLFGNDFHWLVRIAMLLGATGLFGSIVHLSLVSEAKKLKAVVKQLFDQIEK